MAYAVETGAGYIDSEFSDLDLDHTQADRKKSSPKFGNENVHWSINRNVPRLRPDGDAGDFAFPIRRMGNRDFGKYFQYPTATKSVKSVSDDASTYTAGTFAKEEPSMDGSCKVDDVGNEFKWWCDEQGVSDFSVGNTVDDVTPIKFNMETPKLEKGLIDGLNKDGGDMRLQMSDRTRSGSASSRDGDYNDMISVSTVEMSPHMTPGDEWSSFMKPADNDEELERLKNQLLHRLGLKVNLNTAREAPAKVYNLRFDAAVQTDEDPAFAAYKDYELKWLREVNEMLAVKIIEIVNGGKLMAYKTEQAFIDCLQSHLKRSQDEIDRLLHAQAGVGYSSDGEKDELFEEIGFLREENRKLKAEVEALTQQLQEATLSGSYSERERLLEKRLKEEKTSKKVLMDDFSKTLGYMRAMKERLRTLSTERNEKNVTNKGDQGFQGVRPDSPVPGNKVKQKDVAPKGIVKRANTTNCVPSKAERVKFAETSDVYYLPKRSNSELGPFVTNTERAMPILPCQIRPAYGTVPVKKSGGFMDFLKNIKQNFTGSPAPTPAKINVLKVPNQQQVQTQQQIDNYRRHLNSRGLVCR
ncbi:hypothetical protein BgAZ_101180 [Babesia gibsoni]|uniref:Uncharacterized protein n=1 Tax=Babesia gibsoni TaxID=33632 RepID=A0AAD8PF91_BABGI|nr:hypothetical protein BgAZ_101180 [Babesia gibsoni]